MTNAEHIRSMTNEELARHNIRLTYECEVDYDWEENSYEHWEPVYETSDGNLCWEYEEALEYELEWLNKPYMEENV